MKLSKIFKQNKKREENICAFGTDNQGIFENSEKIFKICSKKRNGKPRFLLMFIVISENLWSSIPIGNNIIFYNNF